MGRVLLRLGSQHRLRRTLITGGIAVGVLLLAFLGGVLSGKLEHHKTYHGTGALPPVVTTSTTSTTTTFAPEQLEAQLVEDMSLDLQAQRLSPDLAHRAALAADPPAVAARHAAITRAWSPAKAPIVAADYDRAVVANAANPKAPSVLDAEFVVRSWTSLVETGNQATAVVVAHYRLTVASGVVDQPDQTWTISALLTGGRWQLESRKAA